MTRVGGRTDADNSPKKKKIGLSLLGFPTTRTSAEVHSEFSGFRDKFPISSPTLTGRSYATPDTGIGKLLII